MRSWLRPVRSARDHPLESHRVGIAKEDSAKCLSGIAILRYTLGIPRVCAVSILHAIEERTNHPRTEYSSSTDTLVATIAADAWRGSQGDASPSIRRHFRLISFLGKIKSNSGAAARI